LYGLPQTDLGEFWLGPRRRSLGLFADMAGEGPDGSGGGPRVRPLGPARGVFAWNFPAGRRVPHRGLRAASLAAAVEHRTLRRLRCRADRQCSQLHLARTLVRAAAADRDGGGLFGHGRRRADPAADVAASDRSARLARRIPDLWRHRARPAGAAFAPALAALCRRRTARDEEG